MPSKHAELGPTTGLRHRSSRFRVRASGRSARTWPPSTLCQVPSTERPRIRRPWSGLPGTGLAAGRPAARTARGPSGVDLSRVRRQIRRHASTYRACGSDRVASGRSAAFRRRRASIATSSRVLGLRRPSRPATGRSSDSESRDPRRRGLGGLYGPPLLPDSRAVAANAGPAAGAGAAAADRPGGRARRRPCGVPTGRAAFDRDG
jgi:hypothetical protein